LRIADCGLWIEIVDCRARRGISMTRNRALSIGRRQSAIHTQSPINPQSIHNPQSAIRNSRVA
jgi:hypothetical protein